MRTLWANVLRKSEPEKFSQNIFQFNFFLTTEWCCQHVFCLPMASIDYLRAPRGSQSSNHQTVWNAQDALMTVSFSKIQTTELKYLCLPGDQLDAFPTLLRPSGEQIRGRESSQENKKKGVTHVCLSFLLTSITQHKQELLGRCFLHSNLHLVCANMRYSHSTASIFNVFTAAGRALFRLDRRSRSRITFASSLTWLLYICFDFAMQKGELGSQREVCHHAIKAQRRL